MLFFCYTRSSNTATDLVTRITNKKWQLPSHPLMCAIKARQSLQSKPRKDFQRVTVLLSLAIENQLAEETGCGLMGRYSLQKKTRKVFRSELYSLQNTQWRFE